MEYDAKHLPGELKYSVHWPIEDVLQRSTAMAWKFVLPCWRLCLLTRTSRASSELRTTCFHHQLQSPDTHFGCSSVPGFLAASPRGCALYYCNAHPRRLACGVLSENTNDEFIGWA
eukprot:353624-Chlamydomonas_euryale.AAC.11